MIICKICGKEFNQLNGHLTKHNISADDYCMKFGVDNTFSDESLKKISDKTKQGMTDNVKKKMSENWWTDNRRKSLERLSQQRRGVSPGNKLTNEQFEEKLNKNFPNKFTRISEYKAAGELIEVLCNDCGEILKKTPNYLYNTGCPICNKKNKKPRVNTWNKVSPEQFRDNFNRLIGDEYSLLSEYSLAENYIKVKHNVCGHIWDVQARQFYSNGSRCPLCAHKVSNKEVELRKFVESIYEGDIQYGARNIISPYELDIYIPDKNVAIEFNGTYWHSSLQKDSNYHYNKSSLCEEKGIRLIHIWEYEWMNERQQPILKNIIKNALGLSDVKIYARKCNIVVKNSACMKEFFDKNNIQGFRGGKFSICLEYNKEIVMAYQIGTAFFGKGKYEWEVIRGATKLGYNIVGGASKIWKYFLKEYNPKSCVYYIDYNYFNGSSLPYLGLQYVTSQMSYKNFWVNEGVVRNREPGRHKEIKELQKNGLVIPIYNAGTKVYVYQKKY